MDLQAAENAHKSDKKESAKTTWKCPCNGCAKAVKQERQRITEELNKIDLTKLNGLGMKMLVLEIMNAKNA